MTLDEAIENARKVVNSCHQPLMAFETMNSIVKDNYREENEQLAQWLEELKEYKELEEKLCVMFAGDCNLSGVVKNLERQITEPDKDHPMNARILTYEDAEKWNEYLELEEQGRLLKLPCKVGDTVYCIFSRYTKCTPNNEEFDEYNCQGCEYDCDSKKENYVQDMRAYSFDWIATNLKNFGKTVFLTKSEAEAKLKELRCNND